MKQNVIEILLDPFLEYLYKKILLVINFFTVLTSPPQRIFPVSFALLLTQNIYDSQLIMVGFGSFGEKE